MEELFGYRVYRIRSAGRVPYVLLRGVTAIFMTRSPVRPHLLTPVSQMGKPIRVGGCRRFTDADGKLRPAGS